MSCSASSGGVSGPRVITGEVITSPTRVAPESRCGSTTLSMMSREVRMPTTRPPSSTATASQDAGMAAATASQTVSSGVTWAGGT